MTNDTTQPMPECQWIGNSPTMRPVCCKPSIEGKSYCEEHVWAVYQKGSAHARRKKDLRTVDSVRLWESLFNEALEELEAEGELV